MSSLDAFGIALWEPNPSTLLLGNRRFEGVDQAGNEHLTDAKIRVATMRFVACCDPSLRCHWLHWMFPCRAVLLPFIIADDNKGPAKYEVCGLSALERVAMRSHGLDSPEPSGAGLCAFAIGQAFISKCCFCTAFVQKGDRTPLASSMGLCPLIVF